MYSEPNTKNLSFSVFLETAIRDQAETKPFPYTLEVCRCRYCSYCQNGKCALNRCKLIRRNKSADSRIIVSAIQIIESGFAIEIITSVTERIIGSSRRSAAVGIGYGSIAPGVVGVRNQLGSCLVVYRNDISLQVLLIPISVEYILGIRRISVLYTDGTSVSIIEIQNEIVAPFLSHNQRVAKAIDIFNNIGCFMGMIIAFTSFLTGKHRLKRRCFLKLLLKFIFSYLQV